MVIKPSDLHPPFILDLRPIITNEEGSDDHDNPGNRAKDNPVLGQPRPRWKNSDLPSKIVFQSTSKISTANEHTRTWR